MKILVMHHGGDQVRGTEACLFKTLEALADGGNEIILLRNNDVIDKHVRHYCTEIESCKFPEIMFDDGLRLPVVRYFRELVSLCSRYRGTGIERIYLSGGLPCQLGVPLAKFLGAGAVCHFHHPAPKRYMYIWLVFLVDKIITPSKYVGLLVEAKVKKKCVTLYVGPEQNYYPAKRSLGTRQKLIPSAANDTVIFIQTGNLAKHKRPDLLVRAFSEAYKVNENLMLLLVGDGPMRPELEKITESLGLSHVVLLLGYVESPALFLQNVADVNCLVSVEEGLGISVLEASACRVPSIVTDCTGLAETVVQGRTGIKVKPDSINEIRDAMLTLAGDSEIRERYGEAAYVRVRSEFNVTEYKNGIQRIVCGPEY